LDIGASTGGFTDCLLQRGAQRVYALDVGMGQLAPKLREDPRVIPLEGRNVRAWQAAELPEVVDLITVDVCFISLSHVLPILPPLLQPRGRVVALVKPQFEVGAAHVGRGGVVRDPHRRELVLRRVMTIAEEAGFRVLQATETPRLHARGNLEIFIDLGWGTERGTTAAGQQRLPALQAPTSSIEIHSGIDVGERG
jgi:23S rRNA (cytidine1920-2'-O)/16S rRNA (cytidine1409-2'-O)-methyltransferase